MDSVNSLIRKVPAWSLYLASAGWAAWLFYLAITGGLGVEPINALEREYGEVAIKLLILGLAVTPLRRFAGLNLMKFRRAIGLSAFFFVVAHFLVFAVLDVQSIDRVWQEIVKRPYVTVGMASFLALIPLAITSNNLSVRRMGGVAWRRLHKLTYPAAFLAALHYLWIAKGFEIEPIAHAVVIFALLALRVRLPRRQVAA
ncbi:protein-methionine-sulfoxide reductase heme-binding subunit MsrQ [Ponticoccus sp. SC2-23]|uniref:protein-methionine-sulfoxide reductase heme-binding subunit MsrQ n=1 Tax=Alexandriicola marinus TaxID=2081710 RepID=UPI000FDB2C71|nr:protein-methionine-sulfoxide reductase heme-binding subunit MsrQ [Alexandriicola marinus]MBM1220450.1 protein-methionine-sulfoxide reductase heme-binding subunit MsrQ [Ponticoccus sp. SC6-9]MBM1225136.1 protein-methionine-sulfoxide reductase heme-binding subunit MsrQ [Ponticoccus sp. SC6-15]MBM1228650.1 protein-methionine-sulfoxide reductase heme-binding subunit MsrQ [Ponticoccus sp. SC6-38]MBM1233713.1 protein-methionine-sulfoxide reductase heme-binding subunit MsrQ [Ponticoccus sp. SC6-45]